MQKMLMRGSWRLTFDPGWVVLLKCFHLLHSKLHPQPSARAVTQEPAEHRAQPGVCHLTGLKTLSPDMALSLSTAWTGSSQLAPATEAAPVTQKHSVHPETPSCAGLGAGLETLCHKVACWAQAFRERLFLSARVLKPGGDETPQSHSSATPLHWAGPTVKGTAGTISGILCSLAVVIPLKQNSSLGVSESLLTTKKR